MWENLPLLIFGLFFSVTLIIFAVGALILVFVKDIEKIKKAKGIIIKSIYAFSAIFLVSLIFFLFTYFLEKPLEGEGDFPPAPVTSFPPAPNLDPVEEI